MLFNEPKLLKWPALGAVAALSASFSALQRAEIAEIRRLARRHSGLHGFSALQRAEIAEINKKRATILLETGVSVLFNEPKLLKCRAVPERCTARQAFQCSSTSRNC